MEINGKTGFPPEFTLAKAGAGMTNRVVMLKRVSPKIIYKLIAIAPYLSP